MRSPERGSVPSVQAWGLWAISALFLLGGCNRLTFVKPDLTRGDFQRTAREVSLNTDARGGNAGATAAVQQGQAALARGDLDGAAKAAARALKVDGKSPASHTLAAVVAERRGDSRVAGEHYRRAVELAPTRGGALANYGAWLCGNGQADASLTWFDMALADPGHADAVATLANAGACSLRAGQDELAGAYLERAVTLAPTNAVALGAMSEREFRHGRYLRARAFSQRRLDAAPADPLALLLASQIEQELGDTDAADRYVQQLGAEFPGFVDSGTGDDGKR